MTTHTARIALVGDRSANVRAHGRIPVIIDALLRREGVALDPYWIATPEAEECDLTGFDAIWAAPGSPYASADGAIAAVRAAREQRIPFLGTCGGFQHAILEYARSVLGWTDAEHAETAPHGARLVVAPLACALVEVHGAVRFRPGSRLAAAYGAPAAVEGYHCRYGLDPELRAALTAGPLRVAAEDEAGDVRAVELDGPPFFVATLFQPERAALAGHVPPIVEAFVRAAAAA